MAYTTIKELYSLIHYNGSFDGDPATSRPYIDTTAFTFSYAEGTGLGDAMAGRRPIDVQEWSSTEYIGTTMGRDRAVFGVNFADGRIKGYPLMDPATRMTTPHRLAIRLVRGPRYGHNLFEVQGDTVTDRATGLTWQRRLAATPLSWTAALTYCNELTLAGHSDWRLPNAKEVHTIVDYTRVPAIDPVFDKSMSALGQPEGCHQPRQIIGKRTQLRCEFFGLSCGSTDLFGHLRHLFDAAGYFLASTLHLRQHVRRGRQFPR